MATPSEIQRQSFSEDAVRKVLKTIVSCSAPGSHRLLDELIDKDDHVLLTHCQLEPFAETDHGHIGVLEAIDLAITRVAHATHEVEDLLVMATNGDEAAPQERLEVLEEIALRATHDVDKLERQLERSTLKLHITRRRVKDETVIDVDDVTVAQHHDVAIVSVLDL